MKHILNQDEITLQLPLGTARMKVLPQKGDVVYLVANNTAHFRGRIVSKSIMGWKARFTDRVNLRRTTQRRNWTICKTSDC